MSTQPTKAEKAVAAAVREAIAVKTPWGTLRYVTRDGEIVWKLRCPQCGHEGDIDDPANVMYLDPDWDNPCGDICGWCFRVWRSRTAPPSGTGEDHR